jgi:HAD superfamily hydrolase (TIGR01450 family)
VTASIWNLFDYLLTDLDGVVYEGKQAIEPAPQVLSALAADGIPVGYVTNNSSRKASAIAEQLAGFGVSASPDDIIGSGQTGVELLATLIPAGSRVLVVGGDGLRDWVTRGGFELVADSTGNPAAVIQGFAPDVSWRDLSEAAFAIQAGAKWVATNSDWTLPQERGLAPGNGTLVSAVHTAVGQLPLVAGKPETPIFQSAVRRFEVAYSVSTPLFIGDRIDTDITGANKAGIASCLVLTGVSTRKEVLGMRPEGRPRFIIGTLAELQRPYNYPIQTTNGFESGEALVELVGNKVVVKRGDPKSVDALRAACAVVYTSSTPIYGLEVDPELYE